jgi:hypothetical protein
MVKLEETQEIQATQETQETNIVDKEMVSYISETNYVKFLNRETAHFMKTKIENLFDFDFMFIKQAYNLHDYNDEAIINYIKKNSYINHIFHPKQLYNLFNDRIQVLINEDNLIYIKYDNINYKLDSFINHIDTYSYDDFKKTTIKKLEDNDLNA